MQITPEKEQEVLFKLRTDAIYFIERCLFIVDQDGKKVPFFLNPVQKDFLRSKSKNDIVVKSRKHGLSSAILAYILHACLFRSNIKAVIISHEGEATERLLERLKYFISTCVFPIKVATDSVSEISFPETNSKIYVGTAGAKAFGRGDDIFIAHFSESAHYQHTEVITGVEEAIVRGANADTWIVHESTANGQGNHFHKTWLKANEPGSGIKPHFYGWDKDLLCRRKQLEGEGFVPSDEERDLMEVYGLNKEQLLWRRWKIATMNDPSLYPQEYPLTAQESFLTSGRMVFDYMAIERQRQAAHPIKWKGHLIDMGSEITVKPDDKGPLEIYRSPEERRKYLITVDAADGIPGGAYSVADVYDLVSWEQVAQWRGHQDPGTFRKTVMALGAFYNWSVVAVENNYPGNAVLLSMSEAGYPSLFSENESELGFKTTEKSKAIYISEGREAIKNGDIKLNSSHTLKELGTFVLDDRSKMIAQPGCFCDTVITSCKAADLLRKLHVEPETRKRSFRDVYRRRNRSASGGAYGTRVV